MSKLSFRARALDPSKPIPILTSEDVPDLPDFANINRAVPQIPTGMEKEEESEHHLRMAITAQQSFGLRTDDHVIPTPEVFTRSEVEYNTLYPTDFKMSRQMIHVQLPAFEDELPDYDLDEEDRGWFLQMKDVLGINELKFEEMIECLEKNSGVFKVLDISEAKALLKLEESIVISVYDYWLQKKLNVGKSLLPQTKTEKRDGTSGNNPYIAFRRRTEKMQTRKNRKNDEASYEKMLKLKKDFVFVRDLMDKIKKREAQKMELSKCHREIYEKRYKLEDFDSNILSEILALRAKEQNSGLIPKTKKLKIKNDENASNLARKKRDYKKKKTDSQIPHISEALSSEDENSNAQTYSTTTQPSTTTTTQKEIDDHPDGKFAFKRKRGCHYYAPLKVLPWGEDDGRLDTKYKYGLVNLSRPRNHPIGFARRRIGRGGRIVIERMDFDERRPECFYADDLLFEPESDEENERESWLSQRRAFHANADFSDDEYSDQHSGMIRHQDSTESNLVSFHEKRLAIRKHKQLISSTQALEQQNHIQTQSQALQSSTKPSTNSNFLEMNLPKSFLADVQADLSENFIIKTEPDKDATNHGDKTFNNVEVVCVKNEETTTQHNSRNH